jgi:hypothetical protein
LHQDSGIGRVQAAGAFQQFKTLLEVTTFPSFIRRLEHPV